MATAATAATAATVATAATAVAAALPLSLSPLLLPPPLPPPLQMMGQQLQQRWQHMGRVLRRHSAELPLDGTALLPPRWRRAAASARRLRCATRAALLP